MFCLHHGSSKHIYESLSFGYTCQLWYIQEGTSTGSSNKWAKLVAHFTTARSLEFNQTLKLNQICYREVKNALINL